jgi:hypothetical protein
MNILHRFLESIGLRERDPFPRQYRLQLSAAWTYACHVTKLVADRPRTIYVKPTGIVRGQYVARSPNGILACGWYVPATETAVLVIGKDMPLEHVELHARHEFAHHLAWTKLGTMEHVPEFKHLFKGWV